MLYQAKVRLACTKEGEILAFDLDDLTAIGPYSVYPRTSGIEANQVVNLTGGPYTCGNYRARVKPYGKHLLIQMHSDGTETDDDIDHSKPCANN